MEDMNPGQMSMGKDSIVHEVLACLALLKLSLNDQRMCKIALMCA